MPYRRLPNTDQARIRALRTAVEEGDRVGFLNMPYSYKLYNDASHLLEQMEQALHSYHITLEQQVQSNKNYVKNLKTARLYISHFIQVLGMCVQRNEIKKDVRSLYHLPEGFSVPDLGTESDVVTWGKNIIEGEQNRVKNGGTPIFNPTIAKVKAFYDIFIESKNSQKILQNNTRRMTGNLDKLHESVDPLILQIWNQVEDSFKDLPAEAKRESCQRFGVCYYFRKGEKDAK